MSDKAHRIPVRFVEIGFNAEQEKALRLLVDWCSQRALGEGIDYLREVVFIAGGKLIEEANRILSESSLGSESSPQVRTSASAIALPVEESGQLQCFVIIEQMDIDDPSPNVSALDYLALTIMEEFLHVKHYSKTWTRRGFIRYPATYADDCTRNLLDLAYHFLDEYLVGRWKAGLIQGELAYGENLPSTIDRGLLDLAQIVRQASQGSIEITAAWNRTCDVMKHQVLGPLVRDSGRRANVRGKQSPAGDPDNSKLYSDYLNDHWRAMLSRLEGSYENADDTEANVYEMAGILRLLLSEFGIFLSPIEPEGCWSTSTTSGLS